MSKFILTLSFLFICSLGYSQEEIILEGKLVADSLDNTRINIINSTQKIGTSNSDSGEFSIKVKENDTLILSSVQYETITLIISKKNILQKFLKIKLSEKVVDLDEVQISNIELTGNLKQDINGIKTFNFYQNIPLSNKPKLTSIGRKLFTAKSGFLDPILNKISGRTQMLEKANKNEQLTLDVQKGMYAIDDTIFINLLKIPKEEVKNFLYYCASNSIYRKLIAQNNYLEILKLFQEQAPEFLKSRGLKPAANNAYPK
jgi:hypothetical protein